jgi:hypothetical protein
MAAHIVHAVFWLTRSYTIRFGMVFNNNGLIEEKEPWERNYSDRPLKTNEERMTSAVLRDSVASDG